MISEYIPYVINCLGVKLILPVYFGKIILNCLIVTFIILELFNELFLTRRLEQLQIFMILPKANIVQFLYRGWFFFFFSPDSIVALLVENV